MSHTNPKDIRILAIAPSTRGFGFAVVESGDILVDWGVKTIRGEKNSRSLAKIIELIVHYAPQALSLPDPLSSHHKRSDRVRKLCGEIVLTAKMRRIDVKLFSKGQIGRVLLHDSEGTKHAVAEHLTKRFPDELGFLLPPKRRPWMSEDYRMDIFEAVALALSFYLLRRGANRASDGVT